MKLLDARGGWLYEHRPDVIPHGYVTPEELSLWAVYYDEKGQAGGRGR